MEWFKKMRKAFQKEPQKKENEAFCRADFEYEMRLAEFQKAVETEDSRAQELYATLKKGTPKQLARLNYVLISAKNLRKKGYESFEYDYLPSGIPLFPAAPKRGPWCTFIRFNLNGWPEKQPLLLVSSDIIDIDSPLWVLKSFHNMEIVGTAKYRSPAFGWLKEEKEAVVLRLGVDAPLGAEELEKVVKTFCLMEDEYRGDALAFMVEDGEKEYSFEIASLREGRVDILFRYTVDGNNTVARYFEPELVSLRLNPSQKDK